MRIQVVSSIEKCVEICENWRNEKNILGFVPTMGALHIGHLNLVKRSKSSTDRTVVSIFVNPTQFNESTDFDKYPRQLEQDIQMLEEIGADLVFVPSVDEMYPKKQKSDKIYDLSPLDTVLEGLHRPGHFQGVAQIVDRLLTVVQPHQLFLGLKDFQQLQIISKMMEKDHPDVSVISVDTMREKDGLAMSSRNSRLNKEERLDASNIYKSFQFVQDNWRNLGLASAIKVAKTILDGTNSFHDIEYFGVYNALDLTPITDSEGE